MRIGDWSSDVFSSDLSSRAEKRAAEEIANREKCDDFGEFRPLFEGIEADLKGGLRQAKPLGNSEVTGGDSARKLLYRRRAIGLRRCVDRRLYNPVRARRPAG